MNYRQLSDKLAEKREALQALATQAATRSLTTDENTTFDALETEIRSLVDDCRRAKTAEDNAGALASRSVPVNTHNTTEARGLASYSLLKAVRSTLPPDKGGIPLEGIEKEMHQEAEKEARSHGLESIKGVGIPQMLIAKRDNSVTVATQPEDGSAVVRKDVRPVLDLLRAKSVLRELGVQFLTGLQGTIGMPELSAGAVSTWKGEIATLDKSNQKFTERDFSPHRLGTYAVRSKQFLVQTSPDIEAMLRTDLENSIVQKLEQTAINGSGTGDIPAGIINTAGVNTVALGTNGAAFTRSTMIALMAAVMNQNVPLTNPGYLMNVSTMAKLMDTKVDAGSGIFLMNAADSLGGYKTAVTTNVPGDITKGTGTNLSAMIFGNWRDLLIGQWGGLDITTDPYTLATEGQVRIIIQSFYDIMVQRVKAFAVVKDIVTI